MSERRRKLERMWSALEDQGSVANDLELHDLVDKIFAVQGVVARLIDLERGKEKEVEA